MQKIYPCLWFDNNAEEAVNNYLAVFDNAWIVSTTRWGDTGPGPKGGVLTILFEIEGQTFLALNGGPHFKFNEAVSMVVTCASQPEIDKYWKALSAGGAPGQCGWLKDKFGMSWQIVPAGLAAMLQDPDPAKSNRVMTALMSMTKLDIGALEQARAGN
jgi:predicted 3-demethylubiquinone-9 3-methyltransferase (glyoxalase superfamily)